MHPTLCRLLVGVTLMSMVKGPPPSTTSGSSQIWAAPAQVLVALAKFSLKQLAWLRFSGRPLQAFSDREKP